MDGRPNRRNKAAFSNFSVWHSVKTAFESKYFESEKNYASIQSCRVFEEPPH